MQLCSSSSRGIATARATGKADARARLLPAAAATAHTRGNRCSLIMRASQQPVDTTSSASPARQAISGLVSGIYKVSAAFQGAEPGASPLWAAVRKLDLAGVQNAIRGGADLNERDAAGDTPLLHIAKAGHYKYPPAEIPALLVQSGADLEAKNRSGYTATEVSLLSGWQNIAELLIKNGAQTGGVPGIKSQVTCPDCKRIIAQYNL